VFTDCHHTMFGVYRLPPYYVWCLQIDLSHNTKFDVYRLTSASNVCLVFTD